jgi:hypothetical protein
MRKVLEEILKNKISPILRSDFFKKGLSQEIVTWFEYHG